MIWLTWRQFRGQAATGLAVLAAMVLYLVISGLAIRHAVLIGHIACVSQDDCGDSGWSFFFAHTAIFNFTQVLFLAVVGLAGIFWGSPLIAHEFEAGTHQLAWNQSVTRGRWLVAKLLVLGAVSIAVVGLLDVLMAWWSRPLDPIAKTRYWAQVFPTHGFVAIGYGLFAFATGVTAGLVLRRTVPAIAVALALFAGMQILMPTVVRAHLVPPATLTYPIDQSMGDFTSWDYATMGPQHYMHFGGLPTPQGSWKLSESPVETADGRPVEMAAYAKCFVDPAEGTAQEKGGGLDLGQIGTCLAGYHLHESVTFQPADNYWPMQWAETGVFTGLALLMSGFCFLWVRRR
ncbi:ABC transporter permease subunit [Actinospica robiniae]|uniref:ABC transporter permease subunit n=1 Tax=Actinospica robiniae TaxID=304901 RepID=UPI00042626B6|nr:ABC transporter permease subunit [Actinospica robiniae]